MLRVVVGVCEHYLIMKEQLSLTNPNLLILLHLMHMRMNVAKRSLTRKLSLFFKREEAAL